MYVQGFITKKIQAGRAKVEIKLVTPFGINCWVKVLFYLETVKMLIGKWLPILCLRGMKTLRKYFETLSNAKNIGHVISILLLERVLGIPNRISNSLNMCTITTGKGSGLIWLKFSVEELRTP